MDSFLREWNHFLLSARGRSGRCAIQSMSLLSACEVLHHCLFVRLLSGLLITSEAFRILSSRAFV